MTDPTPIVALEVQTGGGAHNGGGMLTLPDGRLLFAAGDNIPPDSNGRAPAQDYSAHVSKLLIIDPGATDPDQIVAVAAKGVRNVQALFYTDAGKTKIAFADIGGVTAEEINVIDVADLIDTATVENFGWGEATDGLAREGTFHVGTDEIFGDGPLATGVGPDPEQGFLQPYAQIGRELESSIAISGPVTLASSFNTLVSVFSDLTNGRVYGTLAPLEGTAVPVFEITLWDVAGNITSLPFLANPDNPRRSDPRFFKFADGTAGVLIERTGVLYTLTQTSILPGSLPVPLPAADWMLLAGLASMTVACRRRAVRRGQQII